MRKALLCALALLALAALPAAARAAYEVEPGSASFELLGSAGEPELRAGSHPDRMVTKFAFTTTPEGEVEGNARDIIVDLPAGISGDPRATPRCPRPAFAEGSCPAEAKVGMARATFAGLGEQELPIYNIEPEPGEVAETGFSVFIVSTRFTIRLREDDYGMRLESRDLPQEVPLLKNEIELWGVPADHQPETTIPRRAFLTAPTRCDGPSTAALRVRTWQQPEQWMTTPMTTPRLEGCEGLGFSPSLEVAPGGASADSPTGMRIALDLPQSEDPGGRASSQVRSVTVTLPPGFSLSPAVAQGLGICTDAELGLGAPGAAACPDSSKLGTVEILSPATSEPIRGSVYLGEPRPDDPYRVFVAASTSGADVKLEGQLRLDPVTGRLSTVLADLPQLPVSRLVLTFKDGPRAPLDSPPGCTSGTAVARLAPYTGGAEATATASVATTSGPGGSPCLRGEPFDPSFLAGASSSRAGAEATFSTTIRRRDGEGAIERLRMTLPPGLVASLAGVRRCPELEVALAACPAASRVGTTLVEAGAGPSPLPVSGSVYLTGPYRGAPFGLALVLRAAVGPLELGVATIRATMLTDPSTARLTVATDPLPQTLAGVPLRLRTVGIDIDRPGFIRNPTSCQPARVEAVITSADGVTAWPSVPFAVGGCRRLGLDPGLSLALLGSHSRRPGLEIRMRPSRSGANLRSVAVKLPKLVKQASEAIAPCPIEAFRRGGCAPGSRIGSARATTPLLPGPLRGPVHLVQASDVGPPEVWTTLQGEGMRLITRSTIAVSLGGQLLNTLEGLPDVPLRTLTTKLDGGRGSFFEVKRKLCAARPEDLLAEATVRGQSGAQVSRLLRVGLRPACGPGRAGRRGAGAR